MTLLWILLSTVFVGLVSFVGLVFLAAKINIHKLTFYLMSLASGTMLGGAFLHLIPEALEENTRVALTSIALGVFVFFILEKFLIWRHCHLHPQEEHVRPTAAKMLLMTDAIHNFIDGVIIASSFIVSFPVGISVTLAIILHEIPQELGDFGVLIHGGSTVKQALFLNAVTATTAVAGALIAYFFIAFMPAIQTYLVPITAGGFLYIALADLIPQLHERVSLKETLSQIALLAVGFTLTALLKPHHPV